MRNLMNEIKQRRSFLLQVIHEKEQALSKAPDGILNIAATDSRVQYYYKKVGSDSDKRYMRNSEVPLIKELCQKEYNQKVLALAQKELRFIERYINLDANNKCDDVYEKLNIHRKKHVQPIILPDEEFVAQWEQFEYIKKGFYGDAPEYYTDKDERVRSKSEIMIANALLKHNIPYRYEAPIYLSGYGTVYPDFTVLNVRLRKEYLWEHLGMMDDANYVEKALKKIDTYERNNIFPGEKLILTHETANRPINSRMIDRLIECYFV